MILILSIHPCCQVTKQPIAPCLWRVTAYSISGYGAHCGPLSTCLVWLFRNITCLILGICLYMTHKSCVEFVLCIYIAQCKQSLTLSYTIG